MTRPDTFEFRDWAVNWLTERGFAVQRGLPWKAWKAATPTIIWSLDSDGRPAFGLLAHSPKLATLLKRVGIFMDSKPAPIAVFVFRPENSRLHIDIKLEGAYAYPIKVIEAPPYPYNSIEREDYEWRSSFSITLTLRARKPPE